MFHDCIFEKVRYLISINVDSVSSHMSFKDITSIVNDAMQFWCKERPTAPFIISKRKEIGIIGIQKHQKSLLVLARDQVL